ncbi:hypothetical protein B0H17DRAFT_1158366 [Mycena rosella]|uniref:Uncharacterized protein n=1 Tax=Mycena rosella TaxID=1033263 RepID=A0AAD7DRU1_MYCRO|nr:hypothetical protein B0H17DRAFT_1158366 [Mycena rosella]
MAKDPPVVFPEGQDQHLSYPFGLHAKFRLCWGYRSEGDQFFLNSTSFLQNCRALQQNDMLAGILARIRDGIKPRTPNAWFPIGSLMEKLARTNEEIAALRLTKLNDARKLVAKVAELDLHKQLMMAIASGNVQRVVPLLQAGVKNGESVRAILERFYHACVDVYREGPVYNPKGFTEDDCMVGLCALRLGGARLADILHRALGIPGLTTLRKRVVIRPLRASPGMPTIKEIQENIDAYTDGEDVPTGAPRILHRVIMLDKIAVERRARWDERTNMILGACREHCANVPLEFATMNDATAFLAAVESKEVHLAKEATVVTIGALSRDPQIYNLRPICISGTCKAKKGSEHAEFLHNLNAALETRRTHGNTTYRTVSYASDGEAKRGAALAQEFMKFELKSTSLIYHLLKPHQFMNIRIGTDDITPDKDFRHVIKTVRTLLMRKMGIKLLGFLITLAIVKQHLRAVGHNKEFIDSRLNPNDKQNVPYAYQLLNALWSLPAATPSDTPGFSTARRALRIFGKMAYHLVMPYICVTLSLREQLNHLSAAAHMVLILFTSDHAGTDFMVSQTFVNIMLMIKNAYFCVAKVKIDIPDAEFFLNLLGINREEKRFGLIRTAKGPDSNVDVNQLAGRASNLTEISKILTFRPHWDRGPRRLHLPAIINEKGEISKKADHVSPCLSGCAMGEGYIATGQDVLSRCALVPGFDMLCPFGKSLVHAIDPDPPSAFEADPELLRPVSSDSTTPEPEESEVTNAVDSDIDDLIALDESTGDKKHSPHILVDGKKVSKATILSNLMQGCSARLSTDRTRRVAGITALNPSSANDLIIFDGHHLSGSGIPLSRSLNLFLAVRQVSQIVFGSQDTESIPLDLLSDSGPKVSFQILRIIPSTIQDDPSGVYDWRWSLGFETTFHPLNPTVSNRNPGKPTYMFTGDELINLAATVDSQTPGRVGGIPDITRTDRFPYRFDGK